jgi:NAD(P)H-flavin reductase/NADPH-dependent glutamate synthase beta subunit-like oxidoreductase
MNVAQTLRTDAGLSLGVPGFSYPDLYDPTALARLTSRFHEELAAADSDLAARFAAYRSAVAAGTAPEHDPEHKKLASALLVDVAPHLGAFVARLFRVEDDHRRLIADAQARETLFRFKKELIGLGAARRFKPDEIAGWNLAELERGVAQLIAAAGVVLPAGGGVTEAALARAGVEAMDLEKTLRVAGATPSPEADTARRRVQAIVAAVRTLTTPSAMVQDALGGASDDGAGLAKAVLLIYERYSFACLHAPELRKRVAHWVSFHKPADMDYAGGLVQLRRPRAELPELTMGPEEHRRARDGFALTDRRMTRDQVMGEVHYCIYCHDRGKDSCSTGLREKSGQVKQNPLGVPLEGCPLDEKISEAHLVRRGGDAIGALGLIAIDNPMAPGTGHRICNDCMKSCIFQKQEPVNIPQIETGILTDVLQLPWGFEIWALLTRWNPLNVRRPHALPYNGRNVLVVGMGPAGYTLAHYLLNEGFGVVGVDGLKIEPLPADLVGDAAAGVPPRPVRDYAELDLELDQRILLGFGGVSEYGITVRWDKNFLGILYLALLRREYFRIYGGVRFGGTLELDDAFEMGFDHVALATGAGRPTLIDIKNNLIRGIRKASDFLMALQLTGAFKRTSMANLQVRLPAVVVGGGLTAIDTATELAAYYPVQVERLLDRHETLCARLGEETVLRPLDAEDREILTELLEHGRTVREERKRAAAEGRAPRFAELIESWGGVSIVYRKGLQDAPAYRLNHEEVIKALEEGVRFIERLSPTEAVPDRHGALEAMVFERMALKDGKWRKSGETVRLRARSLFVAAGTHPNTVYEKEHPGTFERDEDGEFFLTYRHEPGQDGDAPGGTLVKAEPTLLAGAPLNKVEDAGFFTSYRHPSGRYVTCYGDNHPVYEGNVVKAMASARRGYPRIVALFAGAKTLEAASARSGWNALTGRLDDELRAKVVEVVRLTPTIVEVIVRAPAAARHFQPGQFFRLQNYESTAERVGDTRLTMEGMALTGAWVDKKKGLLSMIVLEMGGSSRLCIRLKPGEEVVVMGPTGAPSEIPRGENVLLAGGGLGNAVLFSIARAMREAGNRIVYFAGYKRSEDVYKRDEIEAGTDQVIWSVDGGDTIEPRRPQDQTFRGNIVQAMVAWAEGKLGDPLMRMCEVDRILAIGSDRMMSAVKSARKDVLKPHLKPEHVGLGSINSTMQCMMKEICAQCLQKHVDPETGAEAGVVFSCFNQDQKLDEVDFKNLNERLRTNSVLEKQTNLWLDHLLSQAPRA